MTEDKIIIKGAREHNLKNIDVEIPRNKLVVITGISGSGKSSLAFDTIYAEGQRRYVESLSAYARQFLGRMNKPDVEYIEGLSPAIAIEQRPLSKNPRSTVGTVTEIYDYLRLLFARIGGPHCYKCGQKITRQTVDQIVDQILELQDRTKIQVLAPVVRGRKGEHKKILDNIRKSGFARARIDGEIHHLSEEILLEKNKKHTIEIIVDRLIIKEDIDKRLADSVQTALNWGEGTVLIDVVANPKGEQMELLFSEQLTCVECGVNFPEDLTPRMFSFNSPFGACFECEGIGTMMKIDPELVVPDKRLSMNEGAIRPFSSISYSYYAQMINAIANYFGLGLDYQDIPFGDLPEKFQKIILYGSDKEIKFHLKGSRSNRQGWEYKFEKRFEGLIPNMERRYRETRSDASRLQIEKYMSNSLCPSCDGKRLRPESLSVFVGHKSIIELAEMSIEQLYHFFENLVLTEKEERIAKEILNELRNRLNFLLDVGLNYLTLDRNAGTLSAGEAQRIRLATQIGSNLVGVLYILDEPTIGLHQRDNSRLLTTLKRLRDLGNTLIVVEHDEETIKTSDYVVDLGPGAGVHGGYVVKLGPPEEIMKCEESITGQYLTHKKEIKVPKTRKKGSGKFLVIKGAKENNLKNIDVKILLGVFTCITGVSGSGKSSLINEILYKGLAKRFYNARERPGLHDDIEGIEHLDKVILISQDPIGRTPRSNPATYTQVWGDIRELFSKTPEAKMRGYRPGRFSFNVKGGRCEACGGAGLIWIEMYFLPPVWVPCEVCKGKRYNRETLEVRYKGKNISDVLQMTVDEALEFFKNIPKIKRRLQTLVDVGLGYIRLGQPAPTLSGGEAQRVKLSRELAKVSTGNTLYLLDEPTTGLATFDIEKLLDVLKRLVDAGNTVVVIEHNPDVIKSADHIIDLGPEGGDKGGNIVAQGTPEELMQVKDSYTGQFLKKYL